MEPGAKKFGNLQSRHDLWARQCYDITPGVTEPSAQPPCPLHPLHFCAEWVQGRVGKAKALQVFSPTVPCHTWPLEHPPSPAATLITLWEPLIYAVASLESPPWKGLVVKSAILTIAFLLILDHHTPDIRQLQGSSGRRITEVLAQPLKPLLFIAALIPR